MMNKLVIGATLLATGNALVAPEVSNQLTQHDAAIRGPASNTNFLIGRTPTGGIDLLDKTVYRGANPEEIALNAIGDRLGKMDLELEAKTHSKQFGLTHLYYRQIYNGLECDNCLVTATVNESGQVVSLSSTAVEQPPAARKPEKITPAIEAINAFIKHAGMFSGRVEPARQMRRVAKNGREEFSFVFENDEFSRATEVASQTVNAQLFYTRDMYNELQLVWKFDIKTEKPRFTWWQAGMSAATSEPQPIVVDDMVKWQAAPGTSKYNAYAMPAIDPRLGERIVDDEARLDRGWHTGSDGNSDTRGNNADAYFQPRSGPTERPRGGANFTYDFPIDFNQEPAEYRDAATTNLFYWNNLIHDVFYEAGFDEESGNFQIDNFGRGGRGNDAVRASSQDAGGFNNANFATPPDGSPGQMRMYLWNQVSPMLDGDLDSGIVIHEYGHGISTRLTGGPQASCLSGGESGGMGEGWGDLWATMFSLDENDNKMDAFPMGEYAAGRGIRPFPYSFDMDTNPQTYALAGSDGYTGVHAVGSIWCTTLMDVMWDMIDQAGFDGDWVNGEGGNNALFNYVVVGLKTHGCSPDFTNARDAILAADMAAGGRFQCTMWRAFARRGLGVSAVPSEWLLGIIPITPAVDGFDVPAECRI